MAKEKLNLTLNPETKQFLKILAINKNKTVSQLIEDYVYFLNKSKELDNIYIALGKYKKELELSIRESELMTRDLRQEKEKRDKYKEQIELIDKMVEYTSYIRR